MFHARRTRAGYELPPYYLVYFLLVELLGFPHLGRSEKVAWSVPVELKDRVFMVEHRKLGLGVFADDPEADEGLAHEVVTCIQTGVKAARPYFRWVASEAVKGSQVNVVNGSRSLFQRFDYLAEAYKAKAKEAFDRKDETEVETGKSELGTWTVVHHPAFRLSLEAHWLALAAIEAFFSWTEHVFIHLAILKGRVTTGIEVADLAAADWAGKFKMALEITDPVTKKYFDELVAVRKKVRNYVAHGAFVKNGEALEFHSGAGAVPVILAGSPGDGRVDLGTYGSLEGRDAIALAEEFIVHLWSDDRAAAEVYIQKSGLPLILTMAKDGSYFEAMSSVDAMETLVEALTWQFDMAANMDW
ncbi:MAG: hypothetical protein M5U22_06125 [Thermoleophilia bacterium]|nr:hypothetical protein [Thermoleophilia bacterium]